MHTQTLTFLTTLRHTLHTQQVDARRMLTRDRQWMNDTEADAIRDGVASIQKAISDLDRAMSESKAPI